MTRKRILTTLVGAVTVALAASGCTPAVSTRATELTYWMWDSNQIPGYQNCVNLFEESNPTIGVNLQQVGWADYWTKLTTGLVADTAPDVFVNHPQQFGTYAALDQLLPLDDVVGADGVDLDDYQPGLADAWIGQDGHRYGLPKDWSAIGLFYNADMLATAGTDPASLWNLDWNPQDGGSYEQLIAHLTVDVNGVRGDEANFDKNKIDVYGLGLNKNNNGGFGETQWSFLALANGWSYADANLWGTDFNYDDPALIETLTWWRSLIDKGYMPNFAIASSGMNDTDAFAAQKYAMITQGSWNARAVATAGGFEVGIAPPPVGPIGERATVTTALGDSIWVGTPHPEEAKQLVAFLATPECQDLVAAEARVLPSLKQSSDRAVEAFAAQNVDVESFAIQQREQTTVPAPVVLGWTRLQEIMNPTMDAFLSGEPETIFVDANTRVNSLFP